MTDPTQRQIVEAELAKLNAELAGLFRSGNRIVDQGAAPGDVFLLASAGRTLLIGVLRELGVEQPHESIGVAEGENFKARLSVALRLPPTAPLVSKCFRAHEAFNKYAHYIPQPEVEAVASEFRLLSDVLFGLLGPYFDTVKVLNALLNLESPTATDVDRLEGCLARPAQRAHFFENVKTTSWLPLLAARGHFSSPPSSPINGKFPAWDEGRYLVLAARDYPEIVADVLAGVSPGLANPIVWTTVCEVCCNLPADAVSRAVAPLVSALKSGSTWMHGREAVRLCCELAERQPREALKLLEALLTMQRASPDGSRRASVFLSADVEPVVPGIHDVFLEDLFAEAVPRILAVEPKTCFKLLLQKLSRALVLSTPEGTPPPPSRHWLKDFERTKARDGVRAPLAAAVLKAGLALAEARADGGKQVLDALVRCKGDIFVRLRWLMLARGESWPEGAIADAFGDPRLLRAWWGGREAKALLKSRAALATVGAQGFLKYSLEAGPSLPKIRQQLEFDQEKSPEQIRRDWIRRRLLWFDGSIPPFLHDLAASVGLEPSASDSSSDLDEDPELGKAVAGWVEHRSPIQLSDWQALEDVQRLSYLKNWKPTAPAKFVEVNVRGLTAMIKEWAVADPAVAAGFALRDDLAGFELDIREAVFDGWRDALKSDRTATTAIPDTICASLLRKALAVRSGEGDSDWHARGCRRSALQFVERAASRDAISGFLALEARETLCHHATAAVVWDGTSNLAEEEDTFERVFTHALNTEAGDMMGAALELARWQLRGWLRAGNTVGEWAGSEEAKEIEGWLTPLLGELALHEGSAVRAAQARVGPQLGLIETILPGWCRTVGAPLLDAGTTSPTGAPMWASYLCGAHFGNEALYKELRPWYLLSASSLPTSGGKRRSWDPFEHLGQHLFVGHLRGTIELDAADGLIEQYAQRAPGDVMGHLYWGLFRGWSDAEAPPPAEFVERAVEWWRWRLTRLQKSGASDSAEWSGLWWLIATPYMPIEALVELGPQTLATPRDEAREGAAVLNRLVSLCANWPREACGLLDALTRNVVGTRWPHLDESEVRTVLTAAVATADPTIRKTVRDIANRLGEHGLGSFEDLA